MPESTESTNASGFSFPSADAASSRIMAYINQIVELYENQEKYLKICEEFNKRQEEAEKELREQNADQTNESINTELSVRESEEERIVQLEPDIPNPADDSQQSGACEILYSA